MMYEVSNKKTLLFVLGSIALVVLTSLSYFYFAKYQPKILRKIEEVKGIKKVNSLELLYPENAERISFSQTVDGSHASYRTDRTQQYVKAFYKNLFLDMGWEEESIKETQDSLIYKFKTDGKAATIITQKETDTILVSVEMIKR